VVTLVRLTKSVAIGPTVRNTTEDVTTSWEIGTPDPA